MDVNVKISFSESAEALLKKLVGLVETTQVVSSEELSKAVKKEVEVSEKPKKEKPKKEDPIEEVNTSQDLDYKAIRADAKKLAIKTVRNKGRDDLNNLNEKFGIKKIDELSDGDIIHYFEELKVISQLEF